MPTRLICARAGLLSSPSRPIRATTKRTTDDRMRQPLPKGPAVFLATREDHSRLVLSSAGEGVISPSHDLDLVAYGVARLAPSRDGIAVATFSGFVDPTRKISRMSLLAASGGLDRKRV